MSLNSAVEAHTRLGNWPQPSFLRRRESISLYGTSGWMYPPIRGDDGLALNSARHSLFADFFTRSFAGMTPKGVTVLPRPTGGGARPQGMLFWLMFYAPAWARLPVPG